MTKIWMRTALLFALVWIATDIGSAQVATGTPPFGSFDKKEFEIIDLSNLNVNFPIPVISKAGRGLPFTYVLSYDSSVWFPVSSSGNQNWQPVYNWGWRGQTEVALGYVSYSQSVYPVPPLCQAYVRSITKYSNWKYHDTFGVTHSFPGSLQVYFIDGDPPKCSGLPDAGTATAADGSGYTLTADSGPNATIITRSGASIVPPLQAGTGGGTFTDRNGNQISVSANGVFTDTLGTAALAVSGLGTPTSPMTFMYTAPSGASAAVTMNYSAYTVQTNFGCTGITDVSIPNVYLVSSIALADDGHPNPDRYTISYEPTYNNPGKVTGRIASIQLPTGGSITYSYGTGGVNGINCADGSATTLTRATTDGTWTYARTFGSGAASTTTVTAPLLSYDSAANQTVIQFQGIYETQRQTYRGSSSTGTLLKTVNTCYNGSASPCTATAVSLPIMRRTGFVQLPGGLQSEVDTFSNTFGRVTEVDEFDFGNPGPGPLLRTTLITFAALGNNLNAFTQTIQVKDGIGNIVSKTVYSYDESTPLSTAGIPQHITVSGARANATSISYTVSGSTSLTQHFTYYDTGTVRSATDVNGAVTTYNYDTGSCANSFPTSVNAPLTLSSSITWDCNGGVQTSVTDENGNGTTTVYTDPYFWRPASVTDPTGAVTNFSYPTVSATETSLLFNQNNSVAGVRTNLDGLGRPLLKQIKQSPNSTSYDSVETDYDALGRPSRVTQPYSAPGGQTNGSASAITTNYDPLNRPVQVRDSPGGTTSYSYAQNDALQTFGPAPTGENTKRRQFEHDALGRLTSVCELTTGALSGTCGQTSQQTGYWTEYTYDALGNLASVTQNAQTANPPVTPQTRIYTYDGAGRLTSEQNPETGNINISYVYDTDPTCGPSSGDLVKKVDVVGNTTCYAYDVLHRVTSITYSGPYALSTPTKYFVYDAATINTTPTATTMVNAKGHLAEAYTATSRTGTKITDAGFSYSARGDVSDVYESSPNSGGYYHSAATYWANDALNQLSGLTGLPTVTYGVDGEGRPSTVSAGPGQNPVTSTTYNVASQPTQVVLGSSPSDTDGFTYDPDTGRMTQYKFTVNSQSVVGDLTWNRNGTLRQLNITDPFNSANTQNCTYSYDDLTRITGANCGTAWSQTFSFDPFGNINKSGSMSFQPTYSPTTNQMTLLPGGFVPSYDANGSVLNDNSHIYSWDAEGRPVSIDGVGLTYDALGRMVEQNRSGTYSEIAYGPAGNKLALMRGQTLQQAFVPLPAAATAVYNSSGLSYYRHPDWLGSSRFASTPSRTMYSDVAYAPFGEPYGQAGTADLSFTGQNQDTVGGLYDFSFREYSTQGRWSSPDPAGLAAVDLRNPQSLNRYAYTLNNPCSFVDPFGLETCIFSIGIANAAQLSAEALKQVETRIQEIFSKTQSVAVDFSGAPDYVLHINTAPGLLARLGLFIRGDAPEDMMGQNFRIGYTAVYKNNIAFIWGVHPPQTVNRVIGSFGAKELGHRLTGIGDLPWDKNNPNIFNLNENPENVTIVRQPGVAPGLMFAPDQISELFKTCEKIQLKKRKSWWWRWWYIFFIPIPVAPM